jgi:hypothetical protein
MRLCRESAKAVTGVAKAFGISILLLDQTRIPELADRFHPHPLTNVADKHFRMRFVTTALRVERRRWRVFEPSEYLTASMA